TDGPQVLKDEAMAAIADGRGNQYPPTIGIPVLREAIVAHQERFYGLHIDPDTGVGVATGASEALAAAILALVDTGDEVLMFEPYFDIYDPIIAMAHGVRVAVPLAGDALRPDLDALAEAITPRSRDLLINSPHNPTGLVLTRDELAVIADLAIRHDLIVISDEAYEHLWFGEHVHIPIATLPGMFQRTVTIGSGGKSFSFTGWKVGWATGPSDLIGAVRTVRQHLSFASSGPFQWAIAMGLGLDDTYFGEFLMELSAKRDLLCSGLAELGFRVIEPQGTYFATTDVRPLGFADGEEFCRVMPHRAGVVAIPHQALCARPEVGAPYVRWAFCKRQEVLSEALVRLASALS
ncbi:MAG: aminotransferase class I/II-fold pyridoxal phosphate-dependent enzyme, partial [Actinomycetales bacterium]